MIAMHDAHELAETSPKSYDTRSKVKKNGGKVKKNGFDILDDWNWMP
jgi:hypothetical protein